MRDPLNAFCTHPEARLKGAPHGPLAGLTFAAKDLFDVAGHVTGAGNPDWLALHPPAARTAPMVQRLVDTGADMVGKTHTDELSRGILGENAHYGTPTNPSAPGRVPGGSSSGSAAAVAGALVDSALGTDTGGSVRIPASFCGIYGIRPTHGRLSLDAAVGPAVERLASLVGSSEQRPVSATVPLAAWCAHQRAMQGREAWDTFGDWIDRHNPRFAFDIADNFLRGKSTPDAALAAAREFRAARRAELMELIGTDTILCLPTAPFPAPPVGQRRSAMWAERTAISTLTTIAGTLGAPQVSLPLALVDGLPVGLSIMARPGADDMLLAFARQCELKTA